ncbi:MAG: DUF6090 family protein [Tunicatimonas sp.]
MLLADLVAGLGGFTRGGALQRGNDGWTLSIDFNKTRGNPVNPVNQSFTKPETLSFKQHLRAVPWLDKLVDLLVVILGISIAFGINNWADGRKNEQAKHRYLVSLANDLRADSMALDDYYEDIQRSQGIIDTLQYFVYEGDQSQANSIAKTMNALGRSGYFAPEDYTYEALQQSGGFGVFTTDSLSIALSKLYNSYGVIESQQSLYQTIQFDFVVPYYFNYDLAGDIVIDSEVYFEPKLRVILGALEGNIFMRLKYAERSKDQLILLRRLIDQELH